MATTRDDIRAWLLRGKADGATFMIVASDSFDREEYPVYVMKNTDVKAEVKRIQAESMQSVREVYSYGRDIEEQLSAARAWFVE